MERITKEKITDELVRSILIFRIGRKRSALKEIRRSRYNTSIVNKTYYRDLVARDLRDIRMYRYILKCLDKNEDYASYIQELEG